jgi:hypothetical protein
MLGKCFSAFRPFDIRDGSAVGIFEFSGHPADAHVVQIMHDLCEHRGSINDAFGTLTAKVFVFIGRRSRKSPSDLRSAALSRATLLKFALKCRNNHNYSQLGQLNLYMISYLRQ